MTLGAAAAMTERIGLMTSVLLLPLRQNTALLAKQAATLHVLSAGRVTLGVGLGSRDDDFSASRVPMKGRGRRADGCLRNSGASGRERRSATWATSALR